MREHESERFHLVFLDAQHTYKDVRREFNWVAKKQQSGDLIFIDDVTDGQFDGICKFVREAKMDTRYREILIDFQPARTKGFAAFEKVR